MTYANIKNTLIFKEFENNANDMFLYKKEQFITQIDTLYYAVYVDVFNWKDDTRKKKLCDCLKFAKETCRVSMKEQPVFNIEGLMARDFGFGFYNLHFGKKDCFDIFVSDYLPNKNTCPIVVQLRSQFLWLKGAKGAFDISLEYLSKVLGAFDLEILKTQENRIDFAFHTNYIQDLLHFFPDNKLKDMQVSSFVRWHKEGFFFDDDTFCDYFTLGRRKSNNVFFRTYNKTKEVIEMGYKQFFIPIWLENGLISKFDKYILEKCFEHSNYNYKEKARCEFYLKHGKNVEHKKVIEELLSSADTTYAEYKKVADCLVPDLTVITNIEFQCKRKFFYNLVLPRATKDNTYKANVYNIFELYHSIVMKLTTDTIRFVKYKGKYKNIPRIDRPCADWWERLQGAKQFEFNKEHWELYRDYQNTLDLHRQKILTINKMASIAAYKKDLENTPFVADIRDFILSLNDNDLEHYAKVRKEKWKDYKAKDLI